MPAGELGVRATMKKYKVTINGNNVLMEVEGSPKRLGFYVARYIESADIESAKDKAADIVYEELKNKKEIQNQKGDGIGLYVDEVEQLDDEFLFPEQPGYSFYVEESH